jgi:hypothetical protein
MIETVHPPIQQDTRTIETVVSAESILINHMIMPTVKDCRSIIPMPMSTW